MSLGIKHLSQNITPDTSGIIWLTDDPLDYKTPGVYEFNYLLDGMLIKSITKNSNENHQNSLDQMEQCHTKDGSIKKMRSRILIVVLALFAISDVTFARLGSNTQEEGSESLPSSSHAHVPSRTAGHSKIRKLKTINVDGRSIDFSWRDMDKFVARTSVAKTLVHFW